MTAAKPVIITSVPQKYPFFEASDWVPRAESVLDSAEKSRAALFHDRKNRDLYVLSHAVLRETLGEYFGCHPGDLVFDRGTYGKPRLAMRIEYPFSFNLSHSDRYTLVAYGNCSSIGADVEVIGGLAHTDGLADAILSREEAARFSSPDSEWLVRIWTVKEAILKATGEGLSRSMKDVRVLSASLRRPVIELAGEDSSGEEWHLMYQEPRCGVAVAIAAKATEVPKFQFMDLTD